MTAPLTVSEVLDKAADLLTPEGAWIRGSYARFGNNHASRILHPRAKCFCVLGAVARAAGTESLGNPLVYDARQPLRQASGRFDLTIWNDDPKTTQAEVVAALRRAAQLARGAA